MTLASMLALLPDNTTGAIDADDLRTIVTELATPLNGTTAARPVVTLVGTEYFDTTLGLPIWWDGADWVNATGAVV